MNCLLAGDSHEKTKPFFSLIRKEFTKLLVSCSGYTPVISDQAPAPTWGRWEIVGQMCLNVSMVRGKLHGFDIPRQAWQCNVKHTRLQGKTEMTGALLTLYSYCTHWWWLLSHADYLRQIRPRGYKTFFMLNTKFILLINVKMPRIVGILTFISMIKLQNRRD